MLAFWAAEGEATANAYIILAHDVLLSLVPGFARCSQIHSNFNTALDLCGVGVPTRKLRG